MRCVIYLCCLLALLPLSSNAAESDSEAKILANQYNIDESGNYEFSFETSNGITRLEKGTIINKGEKNEFLSVSGRYYYLNPDGKLEAVEYVADENGYRIVEPEPSDFRADSGLSANLVASLLGK